MLIRALEQVLEWQEVPLQTYCGNLIEPLLQWLRENDFALEEETYRANHLFGMALPEVKNRELLLKDLAENKIIVSVRGNMIRVSTHLFNTGRDVDQLLGVLQNSYKKKA
jgi:selenocysteine lyase/cysteine desulfurase